MPHDADGAWQGRGAQYRDAIAAKLRERLEHVIRAAAAIADDRDIVVIGSQSVLGQFPLAPEELRMGSDRRLLWFPQRGNRVWCCSRTRIQPARAAGVWRCTIWRSRSLWRGGKGIWEVVPGRIQRLDSCD